MELIRTEKWQLLLKPDQKNDLINTIDIYRGFVGALSTVLITNWHNLGSLSNNDVILEVEKLIHPTLKRPEIKYIYFYKKHHKFPSYFRRVAIRDAFGQVKSFFSRYDIWLDGDRRNPNEKPPKFNISPKTYPSLYKGQCIKYSKDYSSADIKVYKGKSNWKWIKCRLKIKSKRLKIIENKLKSPILCITNKKLTLNIPFSQKVKLFKDNGDIVCSIDLGINTSITATIVHRNGTVLARKFIKTSAFDKDRLIKYMHRIRKKASKTKKMGKGFGKTTYRKSYNLLKNIAHHQSKELVQFAIDNKATKLVFEYMKNFRPRGGAKKSTLRIKFHNWHHRRLREYSINKFREYGGRYANVSPYNTSKFAFDGSGVVKRDKSNYSICTFRSGKTYNSDLNASYNIASKYFLRDSDVSKVKTDKNSVLSPRMPATLSLLIKVNQGVA